MAPHQILRAVGGAVVDHQQFEVREGLGEDRVQGRADESRAVVRGDDHADPWSVSGLGRTRHSRVIASTVSLAKYWVDESQNGDSLPPSKAGEWRAIWIFSTILKSSVLSSFHMS